MVVFQILALTAVIEQFHSVTISLVLVAADIEVRIVPMNCQNDDDDGGKGTSLVVAASNVRVVEVAEEVEPSKADSPNRGNVSDVRVNHLENRKIFLARLEAN